MKQLRTAAKRTAAALVAAALLTACATTGTQMQAECEAKHSDFPSMFQCTYDNVATRNPSILQDARAKLYLLRGEQLALQVLEGKLSNLDAKVAWQTMYVEMKTAKEQELFNVTQSLTRSLEQARANMPSPISVQPTAKVVNCTSTKLGPNVYTTCM